MIDNKEKYREICRQNSGIPLFLQAWWMDATCGSDWNVLLSYGEKKELRGVFVYHYVKRFGRLLIVPATLTQYSGTWLFYPDGLTIESRYSFENGAYFDLIRQVGRLGSDFIELNFHYSQNYWQPFYWSGYSQTTRYTYRFEDISDVDAIYDRMSHRKRQKSLAKAKDNFELGQDITPSDFYDLYAAQLKSKGKEISYPKDTFLSIHKAASERGQGRIFTLYDKDDGSLAVSLFVVWDTLSAYNLVIYIDEAYRSSGASTLIILEAIKYLSSKTKCYDFEGSMIKGVALKNQSFGATLTPFSQISKINNPILKVWRAFKR